VANNSQSEKETINMSDFFNAYSRQDWEDLALETLSDKSIESLNNIANDGIEIKAIYSSEDQKLTNPSGIPGVAPFTRGNQIGGHENGTWDIRALIDDSNPELANKSALNELLNGSTSLFFDSEKIGIESINDLDKALEDVFLNMTSIWFKPQVKGPEIAKWMIELWDQRDIEKSDRHGGLGIDPIGASLQKGTKSDHNSELSEVPDFIDRSGFAKVIDIDSSFYPELDGSTSAELAYSLSVAVHYLRELEKTELEIETVIQNMYFTYSSNSDQFMTIAKFRAARRLWAQITKECGATTENQTQIQHAVISNKAMDKKDPWFNSFNATVAAFAAGIGGAEAITVIPFSLSDEISGGESKRRIARNTQLLLAEESHIGRVVDPAGGSWFVENLTEQLAQKSWETFQQIESSGGIVEVLKNEQKVQELLKIPGSSHD
tara:strand:- start:3042 stop:4346 length:1305 start_codon:yes stop_codon:yes gene_type:complete